MYIYLYIHRIKRSCFRRTSRARSEAAHCHCTGAGQAAKGHRGISRDTTMMAMAIYKLVSGCYTYSIHIVYTISISIYLYIYTWLVVWNMFCFPYIGKFIIPIDELVFFRGVGIPPNRKSSVYILCMIMYGCMIYDPFFLHICDNMYICV